MKLFLISKDCFIVGFASLYQIKNDSRKFMGRRSNCFWWSMSGPHPSVEMAKIGLTPVQGMSSKPQSMSCTIWTGTGFGCKYSSATYLVVRAKAQPRTEMTNGRKFRKIRPYFCKKGLSGQHIDSINLREVGTKHSVHLRSQVEIRLVALRFWLSHAWRWLRISCSRLDIKIDQKLAFTPLESNWQNIPSIQWSINHLHTQSIWEASVFLDLFWHSRPSALAGGFRTRDLIFNTTPLQQLLRKWNRVVHQEGTK